MAIDNEELMRKFVRTGMIMRHIDGEGCHHKHGGHGGHRGRCHGHGEGRDYERAHAHGHEETGADHRPGPEGHGHGKEGCGKHRGQHRRGQMRVIAMVAMQEGINQKDLAFLLGIRPQTLGEMLQKLEAHGLVERKKSETDGRAIEVYLTDSGRAHAADIAERRKLVAADIFAVLTDEEKEQLAGILDKLGEELDKHRPKHHGHRHGHGSDANDDATGEDAEVAASDSEE